MLCVSDTTDWFPMTFRYIYDVKSGKLVDVPEAATAGKASKAGTVLEPIAGDG
jgi:hypothetical protein